MAHYLHLFQRWQHLFVSHYRGWLRRRHTINPTDYTAHLHPGRFEGEISATEYFHEQMLNGGGETLWADLAEGSSVTQAVIFRVNADETAAFNLPIGATFMIREDSRFVYGTCHENRAAAEKKFRDRL
jgi:hypothetical protein